MLDSLYFLFRFELTLFILLAFIDVYDKRITC